MTVRRFEPRYGFAAIVWCAVILWASTTPEPPGRPLLNLPMGDKVVHLAGYALLCWLVTMSLGKAVLVYPTQIVVIVPVAFSILYGIVNEIIQMSVAYRSYELGDIAANALGAVLAQIGFLYVQSRKRTRRA